MLTLLVVDKNRWQNHQVSKETSNLDQSCKKSVSCYLEYWTILEENPQFLYQCLDQETHPLYPSLDPQPQTDLKCQIPHQKTSFFHVQRLREAVIIGAGLANMGKMGVPPIKAGPPPNPKIFEFLHG